MANVQVQKVDGNERGAFSIFAELAERFEGIRNRAFELFEKRGCEAGHSLEDWLRAEREILGFSLAEFTDKGEYYEIQIALPGFDVKDVQVTATTNEVVAHAASTREKKSESEKVFWSEFTSNEVYRRILTPTAIDIDKTTATLDKGLLRITVPKIAETKTKAVAIQTASAA